MKPSLYLRTLGRFELVWRDRGEILPVPAGKSRALLVYLALMPHEVRREYLADLIWPDLPVEAGRFNLRHTLFYLRRLCNPACGAEDLFTHDREHVSLTPGMLDVDVSRLFVPGANVDEEMLCQDDFVANLHLPGCDEFDGWLAFTHERIRLAQVGVLDRLSSHCEARGDVDAAIALARRLIDFDPYNDAARQRMMRLLAAAGWRQAVMVELECFSSLLMRDLGVYSKAETVRLAEELSVEPPGHAEPTVIRQERRLKPRRERRSATVLYCELANSLAADASLEFVAEAEKLFAAVVGKYEGTVLRSLRWGMLAYFGYPLAWEGAPARAVHAALAASETFTVAEMPVRSGLHLGLMVCDAQFPDLSGELAEIAQRLCLAAEQGEVVISGELLGALAGRFTTVALGEQYFRGMERPFQIARVTGTSVCQGGDVLPQLFGREGSVSFLENALSRVKAGETVCMSVYGAVGMGKSTLANVAASQARQLGMRVIKLHFLPDYHYKPYYPVSFYLSERFRLYGVAEEKASQLTQALAAQGFDSDQDIFATLFSLAGNESADADVVSSVRRKRMIAGLADLVQGLCERQPVLLIAEDIHRADPSSSELLVHLVSQVKSRLLILSTSLEAPISDKERESESIRLAPLDVTQAKALVRSVAEGEVDDACMERIVDLAAGVPFFLIEMARGNCEGASPSCIQAILQVRLDKLGADKRVAQMASVFGLCVEPDSLSILCDLSVEKLGESLRTLLATAILQWDDDGRLVFQNASLRDAVYFSLMEEDRRKAHCRAAQLLSKQSTDKALVAYHFEMAREWEKAARWWLDAGEHDVLLHANREALDHFSAGIASAERMPEGVVRDKLLQQLHSRQKSCSGILPESQRSTCFQALS